MTVWIILGAIAAWVATAHILGPLIGRRIRGGHGPRKGDRK